MADPQTFEELTQRGQAIREEVLGSEHIAAAHADRHPGAAVIQEYIEKVGWGFVWGRDDLSRRDRSMITVAVLAALGHERELELHVRGALQNGCTREELYGIAAQLLPYAGVPAATLLTRALAGA